MSCKCQMWRPDPFPALREIGVGNRYMQTIGIGKYDQEEREAKEGRLKK